MICSLRSKHSCFPPIWGENFGRYHHGFGNHDLPQWYVVGNSAPCNHRCGGFCRLLQKFPPPYGGKIPPQWGENFRTNLRSSNLQKFPPIVVVFSPHCGGTFPRYHHVVVLGHQIRRWWILRLVPVHSLSIF